MSQTAKFTDSKEPDDQAAAEDQDDHIVETPGSRREAMVEEISAARPWAQDEAEGEGEEETGDDLEAAEGEDGPEDQPDADAPAAAEHREPPDDFMITAMVDGRPTQMRYGEMKRSVQIEATARSRLEEANARLEQSKQHPNIGADDDDPADAASGRGRADIDYKELANTLQYGDTDAAAEAVESFVDKLRQRPDGEAVDEGRLRESIALDVQNQIEWGNAVARFGEEYKDILSDERLARLAGQDINASMQQAIWDSQNGGAPRRPFWDIFSDAADGIRKWAGAPEGDQDSNANGPGQNEPVVDVDTATREERKVRHSSSAPRPRSRQRSASRQADQPQSQELVRRSAIEEMQRQRGQLVNEEA